MNPKISPEVQNIVDAIVLASRIDEQKIVNDILLDIAKGGPDYTDIIKIDLSVDRTQVPLVISGAGTLVHAVEASDDLANISVGFRDGESSEDRRVAMKDGKRIYRPYVKIFIYHAAQSGKYIKLMRGIELPSLRIGVEDDSGEAANSDLVQALGNSSAIVTSQVNVGTSATLIAAANASRKRITIRSRYTSPVDIFIGPTSGVTISNGYALSPGDVITINTLGAIYGITSTAGQVTVMEE